MSTAVLGLDVGGANLKAAHTCGAVASVPFPLWRNPAGLVDALKNLIARMPAPSRLAVTMTGELCDCWENKRQGVEAILTAVSEVAGPCPVQVWTNRGEFIDLPGARSCPHAVASANWLALACYAGRLAPTGPALLLDIGTTTTDIIPLQEGLPTPAGRTDPERLASGELVYLGWKRTPVCALLGPSHASELFATTHDVYLILGLVPEDPSRLDTADGQPATRLAAHRRLVRMYLADLETSQARESESLAREVHHRLITALARAIARVSLTLPSAPRTLLVSGSGEFLLPAVLESLLVTDELKTCPVVSLAQRFGAEVSTAACAYAVAHLGSEQEE